VRRLHHRPGRYTWAQLGADLLQLLLFVGWVVVLFAGGTVLIYLAILVVDA
jgi:hypothetical protein